MNAPASLPPVRTTCPYCGVGCGVLAKPDGFGGAHIEGDPAHPANFGRLCSKGSALGETLSLEGRLLYPLARTEGTALRRVSWTEALTQVARGFQDAIARHGPGAVGFYVSGQLLTEDYYVANKLMKGFIGSGNIDTNSRLCMASSVAGHKRAFGSDTVPGCYEDLDEADLLVLVGSNAAWCHPVLYRRVMKNRRERGAKIVVIDPRRTATAEDADLFLPIAPGMDSVLFSGLLVHVAERGALDRAFISEHTQGFAETLARARHIAPELDAVAQRCGLPESDLTKFYDWFRTTGKTVTLYSQGVNQSAQGTDKVNAIINCHLATGRIGRPGMGPFSLTGQPNAMGGREVGGLANQLAAHMSFDDESLARVSRFWGTPRITRKEGLKAIDLFDSVASGHIKALWVMGTNPAVSLPRADAVSAALRRLELFVVSDVVQSNDTIRHGHPHVLLPAATWGEKDGTVTNSERCISRQRAFLCPPEETRPDWWIVSEVAKHMGYGAAFPYRSAAEIFKEHARLSALDNDGARDFDIGGLANLTPIEYDALEPVQWPVRSRGPEKSERLFGNGRFLTSDGRARFVPVAMPKLAQDRDSQRTFVLNTGRVRDQWHTMTRTGKSPRLGAHVEEPTVDIHPDDARAAGVPCGGFVRLASPEAHVVLRVRATPGQRRGELFAPMHWNAETASSARIGALVACTCDPYSGQPELKATPVSVAPVSYAVHGFLLSRGQLRFPRDIWWARVAVEGGVGYRFAAPLPEKGLGTFARTLVADDHALIEYEDAGRRIYRGAAIVSGRLEACVFLAHDPSHVPDWTWLKRQLAGADISAEVRRFLLAGRMPEGAPETGPIICACFGIGQVEIENLIRETAATVEAVGKRLRAGTNCGSCQPEIRRLIAAAAALEPKVLPADCT